jgi:deoxycytidylate deaminase
MSAPCTHCTNLIRKYGIKKICYTDTEGEIVCVKTKDYCVKHISTGFRFPDF